MYFNRNWLGFRCMRMLHFLQVPEILILTHILKTRAKIRIVQVFITFITLWFVCAGFFHLVCY